MILCFSRKLSYLNHVKLNNHANRFRSIAWIVSHRKITVSSSVATDKQSGSDQTIVTGQEVLAPQPETDGGKKSKSRAGDAKASFDEHLHRVSQNKMVVPGRFSKMCLMWTDRYEHRDDIPERVELDTIRLAGDKVRVVINMWMAITLGFAFFTIIKLRQIRRNKISDSIHERQMTYFDEKNKIFEEEYRQKKLKEKLEKEKLEKEKSGKGSL